MKEKKKHELLENRFPITKTHFQDSCFRIHRPDVFFTENDRRILNFIENDIFRARFYMLTIQKS